MLMTERFAPSFSGRGAFPPVFRLSCAIGLLAGAGLVYQRSCLRFYGWSENAREVDLDMREMVDKVKKGEPLYGESELTPYMQGVAARNSRYSALMSHVVPMGNFVNHNQVSMDHDVLTGATNDLFSTVLTLQNIINKRNGSWKLTKRSRAR